MDQAQLEKLLGTLIDLPNENECVEFKHNNGDPEAIGKYISALSNSACIHGLPKAYLVFGVDDETHAVLGTSFSPRSARVGGQALELWLGLHLQPHIDFRMFEFRYQDKPVAIIEIESASTIPVKFKNIAFIRVGSNTTKLSNYPERERKIWSLNSPSQFELGIADEGLEEYQVNQLINVPEVFRMLGVRVPADKEGVFDLLESEKLVLRTGRKYSVTNLGAIAFARNLDAFPLLAKKAVRLIAYSGKNKLSTEREIEGIKGYAAGFEGLINHINIFAPQNEAIGSAFRVAVHLFPDLAVRELVANALIHQDFTQSGTNPMIEIYADRMEITNNGIPLITPDRFIDEPPRSRNETLAGLMRRLGLCEERGSGIDKVVATCERYQLPAPDFIQTSSHTKAVLYAPRPLSEMDKQEKIRACYQHACLKFVSNERMTNASLRARLGIAEHNYSIASRIISDTTNAGFIRDYDPNSRSKKHASYVPFWAP